MLNYIGPNEGQGIQVYEDGTLTIRDTSPYASGSNPGDRALVIGKFATDQTYFSSVMSTMEVDELLFFNEALTEEIISAFQSPPCVPSIPWTPPEFWGDGPNPVVYRSFDTVECFILREETQMGQFDLQTGKVSKAIHRSILEYNKYFLC